MVSQGGFERGSCAARRRWPRVRLPGSGFVQVIGLARLSVILVLAVCALGGCAQRPTAAVLAPVADPPPNAKLVTVYVASMRARARPDSNDFTNQPARQLNYASFTISVPPDHKPGNIEWPKGRLDPAHDFVVVRQEVLTKQSFDRAIAAAGPRHGPRRYGVFVHGFNNNFQEALYRLTQMAADANMQGTPVLYDWPSVAKVTGYVTDKDNATYSRDGLVSILTLLARQSRVSQVTVLGHSMGGWLTVEAVRQLRLMGRNSVIRRLRVILAAPDIDVDVFLSQLRVIGPLNPPMVLLVSTDDRALRFSSRIGGDRKRAGAINVDNPVVREAALRAHVEVIDISKVKPEDAMRHSRVAQFAALYPKIETEDHGDMASFRKAGAYVFNGVGSGVATLTSSARTPILASQ